VTAVAVVALGAGLAGVARRDAAETSFSRQLADGCEELEVCRELELESERRVRSCWVGCGRAVAEQRMARLLRYRAEERRAVREHYRERDAAERATQQVAREEALERWRREEAARVNADERERRRVLELERLRQAHAERALAEERRRRVSYLALLGAEGRAERLRRCHAAGAPCDALVLDLVEAADEASEKRDLTSPSSMSARSIPS
jgi:hypothetical protein